MTTSRGKIVVVLALLVLASGVAGVLAGRRWARAEIAAQNNPQKWNEHVIHEFEALVRPTPEQAGKVRLHLDRAVRELQEIRRDTIARSTNVIGRLVGAVEAELTPDQRKAFERMKPGPGDLDLELLNTSEPGGR